mgnify:CR=1 FL=1
MTFSSRDLLVKTLGRTGESLFCYFPVSGEVRKNLEVFFSAHDEHIVVPGVLDRIEEAPASLTTRWLRRTTMDEFVVTEAKFPGPAPATDSYTVRHLTLRLVGETEFGAK